MRSLGCITLLLLVQLSIAAQSLHTATATPPPSTAQTAFLLTQQHFSDSQRALLRSQAALFPALAEVAALAENGQRDPALATTRKAAEQLKEWRKAHLATPEDRMDYAETLYWYGYITAETAMREECLGAFGEVAAQLQQLPQADDRVHWLGLATEVSRLGNLETPTQAELESLTNLCNQMLDYYKGNPVIDTPVKLDLAVTVCAVAFSYDIDAYYASTRLAHMADSCAAALGVHLQSPLRLTCAKLQSWQTALDGRPAEETAARFGALLPNAQTLLGYTMEFDLTYSIAETYFPTDLEKAIPFYQQAYTLGRKAWYKFNSTLDYVVNSYLSALLATNRTFEALQTIVKIQTETSDREGVMSKAYRQNKLSQITVLKKMNDLKAINSLIDWEEAIGRYTFDSPAERAKWTHTLAEQLIFLGQTDKAKTLLEKEVEQLKGIDTEKTQLGMAYHALGRINANDKEYNDAKRYYNKAIALLKKQNEALNYIEVVNDLVRVHISNNQLTIAMDIIDQMMDFLKDKQNYLSASFYAVASIRLIICDRLGETHKEQVYKNEYLELMQQADDDYIKGNAYFQYADYLIGKTTGEASQALRYAETATTLLAKYKGDYPQDYRYALMLCAQVHQSLGQFDKEKQYLQLLAEEYETRFNYYNDNATEYVKSLLGMMRYAFSAANNELVLHYLLKVSKLINDPNVVALIPEHEKEKVAVEVFTMIIHLATYTVQFVSEDYLTDETKEQMKMLNNMLRNAITDSGNSLSIGNLSVDLSTDQLIYNYANIELLFALADYYSAYKEYEKSLKIYQRMVSFYSDNKNLFYPAALAGLAATSYQMGDLMQAKHYAQQYIALERKAKNEATIRDNIALQMLFYTSSRMGHTDDAIRYAIERFDLHRQFISPLFSSITETERVGLHEKYHLCGCNINQMLHKASASNGTTPQQQKLLAQKAYDAALFYKGLLLRSSSQVRRSIYDSGDEELIESYNRLTHLKKQLMNSSPTDTASVELRGQIDKEESLLMNQSAAYRANMEKQETTWEQVSKALSDTEAAIEFVTVPDSTHQNPWYAALILRRGDEAPRYVKLFEQKQLDSLLALRRGRTEVNKVANFYSSSRIGLGQQAYKLIFAPIIPHLQGAATVYYSPTQALHSIAMTALCNEQKQFLGDLYDLRLTSSTATIAHRQTTAPAAQKSISLYGGIVYNAPEAAAPTGSAAEWSYLTHSLLEVQSIDSLFRQGSGWSHSLCHGREASEASLRQYATRQSDILHIATHGYYFDAPNASGSTDSRGGGGSPLQVEYEQYLTQFPYFKGDAMYRAGLLFAGANEAWTGRQKASPEADGIVMASEIAEMNLGQTSLVTLSACETGVGFNNNNEGVFGLQRAFKLAGAESIIMSLWEVNDASGKEFMQTFYSYLLEGMEKHAAFRKAQQELRKRYVQANHWAAFVMMD